MSTDTETGARLSFTVPAKRLRTAVQDAARGADTSARAHPIMGCVLIALDASGDLTLTGTDLEIAVTVREPVFWAPGTRPGTVCVPAKMLDKVLAGFNGVEIRVAAGGDFDAVISDAATGETFTVRGQDPEDFPTTPAVSPEDNVLLGAEDFAGALRTCPWAAAKEKMRFALDGVLVDLRDGATFVASDGRRLSRFIAQPAARSRAASPTSHHGILPVRALTIAAKLFGRGDAVRVAIDPVPPANSLQGQHVALSDADGRRTIVARCVEGTFPAWREIIDSGCGNPHAWLMTVEVEALRAALDRVALMTERDAPCVALELDAERGTLTVATRSEAGSAQKSLPASIEAGTPAPVERDPDVEDDGGAAAPVEPEPAPTTLRVGFNPDFLTQALRALVGDTVEMIVQSGAPLRLGEGAFTHVVMPVSLD